MKKLIALLLLVNIVLFNNIGYVSANSVSASMSSSNKTSAQSVNINPPSFKPVPLKNSGVINYFYTHSSDLTSISNLLKRPDIGGVEIIYNWKELEPAKDDYRFSKIEDDLRFLNKMNKKLFIQIQDRFFSADAKNVPQYLIDDPIYSGGIVPQNDNAYKNQHTSSGWVAQQWNPKVQERYQLLLQALAKKFDGRVYGVSLPATAIDLDINTDTSGFSCNKYFNAEIDNMGIARKAFKKSYVVQYVNFWPCEWQNDHQYMSRVFEYAVENNIGLGSPDIIPNKSAQMKNSYPFFNQYKGKLPLVVMAVQKPTLSYINPKTDKPFTKEEFSDFGENYLGANIIFWSTAASWLSE